MHFPHTSYGLSLSVYTASATHLRGGAGITRGPRSVTSKTKILFHPHQCWEEYQMSPDGEALRSVPSHVRPSCALGRLRANALSVMGQKLVAETEQGWVGSLGLTRSGIEPKGFLRL